MICTLTARRLRPGTYDAFRDAWDAAYMHHEAVRRWTRIYHARDVADPDIIVSFGIFDGTLDELRQAQALFGDRTLEAITPNVAAILLDGSYEVLEELTP